MDREHILTEIRRTAQENGGVPLGQARFGQQTGIRRPDWFGIYWTKFGDALQEAGFEPNVLQTAHGEDFLLESYIGLVRELGRFPVYGELLLKRRQDSKFPSNTTFRRFGRKTQLAAKILEYCRAHSGFDDVAALDSQEAGTARPTEPGDHRSDVGIGSVYLLKAGGYYKIGKTNALGRRERELAIQLPEKSQIVHEIKTDDPDGIEAYWHGRFDAKRKHGEWFALDPADVRAFKRRKFM